jgi:putative flippase GtrA
MKTAPVKELTVFALFSASTLAVDIVTFVVLSNFGFSPFISNACSSTLAALLIYFASSKYAFLGKPRVSKAFAVVTWYLLATLIWSSVIQFLAAGPLGDNFLSKAITVPFSFLANYLVSKYIIQKSDLGERGSKNHEA